jgi:hypothetical protein
MEVFYQEVTGIANFSNVIQFPFSARHVEIVHIAGAGVAEISFNAADTHAKLSPQPRDTATYPVELGFYNTEGISKLSVKGTTATVSIRAWL